MRDYGCIDVPCPIPLLMSLLYVIRMTLRYAVMMAFCVLPFVIMLQTTDCAIRHQNQCWCLLEICGASNWSNVTPSFNGWGPLYVHVKTTSLPAGFRQIQHKHEEYGAMLYMVYPGVKLKTLVYVPHINLWTRDRERERKGESESVWTRTGGAHDET